ncbi:hypothetical protein PFICI_00249 [Pestalotiopsis fici W106-1]|uniref:Uncharacterized protein n=1 Tax=Pestalotiopsis fici (strain W106-1 / CGMCC3.15140) TaxID=1229662 RepID=W3XMC2_PESFW|nr:uncharacterized protein PFICI_00249 [Pestalotiopsis fici W106-1]ETS86421.1 hypothetical protein PFICI_00249 [Pestalotiopsis fici W106-1]
MSSPTPYASSTYSTSTTYSVDAIKASASSQSAAAPSQKRSLGKKVKSVLTSMGEHPTARYDRKHGLEPKPMYAPVMPVSKI